MNTEPGEREEAPSDTRTLLRRLKDFLFDNCNHNERDRNYDWCPSCVMAFMEVVSKPSDSHAATRMRDLCVAKVKAIPMPTHLSESGEEIVTHFRARVIRYLESLTLDGEKEHGNG